MKTSKFPPSFFRNFHLKFSFDENSVVEKFTESTSFLFYVIDCCLKLFNVTLVKSVWKMEVQSFNAGWKINENDEGIFH